MKKTAGELVETIPVEEETRGTEIRVIAWCPVCGKQFSSPAANAAETRTSVVNTAVAHIRCFHPEV